MNAQRMEAVLARVMPLLNATARKRFAGPLWAAMQAEGITTRPRIAMYLANLAHETGQLRWWSEFWGPSAQQRKYDPASGSRLARTLGNVARGDGFRYRGRGPIMVTGRHNYRRVGKRIKQPLEAKPDLLLKPAIGFAASAAFWADEGLNAVADRGDFRSVCVEINGGLNGYPDRVRYYRAAVAALEA